MMQMKRLMIGAAVSFGLIAGSITAAEARPRGWNDRGWNDRGWGNRGWHRRDNGFNVGDAIGIAALIGAVAVVANSVSKDRVAPRDRDDDSVNGYPNDRYPGDGYLDDRNPGDWDQRGPAADVDPPFAPNAAEEDFSDVGNVDGGRMMPIAGEERAVDACAVAAREEATRSGGYAEVRRIGPPQAVQGGYNIDGEVERRGSYRDSAGETRRFTCTVQGDQVATVYLSRDLVSN